MLDFKFESQETSELIQSAEAAEEVISGRVICEPQASDFVTGIYNDVYDFFAVLNANSQILCAALESVKQISAELTAETLKVDYGLILK